MVAKWDCILRITPHNVFKTICSNESLTCCNAYIIIILNLVANDKNIIIYNTCVRGSAKEFAPPVRNGNGESIRVGRNSRGPKLDVLRCLCSRLPPPYLPENIIFSYVVTCIPRYTIVRIYHIISFFSCDHVDLKVLFCLVKNTNSPCRNFKNVL